MVDVDYSEMFETEEVNELLDQIVNSKKNRILWRIFSKKFKKKGSFINLFGLLMYYGGMYDAHCIIKDILNK